MSRVTPSPYRGVCSAPSHVNTASAARRCRTRFLSSICYAVPGLANRLNCDAFSVSHFHFLRKATLSIAGGTRSAKSRDVSFILASESSRDSCKQHRDLGTPKRRVTKDFKREGSALPCEWSTQKACGTLNCQSDEIAINQSNSLIPQCLWRVRRL